MARSTAEEKGKQEKLAVFLQEAGVKSMADIQELFKSMVGTFLEKGLEGELDDELGYSRYDYRNKDTENSRNGHSKKTLKSSFGNVEVNVPRDRQGEFEPQLVKKNQTTLTGDIEEKILSMYAKGMTTADIEAHIKEIYGLEVSDSTVSRITDKILLWFGSGKHDHWRPSMRWYSWTQSIFMCDRKGRSSRRQYISL